MIPKIIHRVWISDDLPDPNTDIGKCFYSQEKLKDYGYEIRTYTAKNFDFSICYLLCLKKNRTFTAIILIKYQVI